MKSTIDEILKQVNIENIYGKMSKKKNNNNKNLLTMLIKYFIILKITNIIFIII